MSISLNQLQNNERVDLCFLVDITGSMNKYVQEIEDTMKVVPRTIRRQYSNFELRCAFSGFRDFENLAGIRNDDQIIVKNFTNNSADFEQFISQIECDGGRDGIKDIFRGKLKI
jgi:putative IMPACT (imprinted ancient) family translation regulator